MTAQHIAQTLSQEILNGTLAAGAPLSQVELAARFQVSRIPIRDAIALLAAQKLVVVQPNRGAYVVQLSADELSELYEMRILLECNLLTKAMQNPSKQHFEHMQYMLKRTNLEAETTDWAIGDWAFHQALYSPAGRPRQISAVAEWRQICQIHLATYYKLAQQTPKWTNDHKIILTHYVAGNVEQATKQLGQHLQAAQDHLMMAMQLSE